jgi:hypothetical protein
MGRWGNEIYPINASTHPRIYLINMGILQDIERLGLKLDDDNLENIKMIEEDITKNTGDELVRTALIEMHVSEFISLARPDIMDALVNNKNKEVEQLRQRSQRKFDEKGNRICDEQMCDSAIGVAQCIYCGKFVCKEHNYGKDERCCYDCSIERTYGKE